MTEQDLSILELTRMIAFMEMCRILKNMSFKQNGDKGSSTLGKG